MPVLKNSRHELFCQALSQGQSQDSAYKAANYKGSRQHAYRLATKGYIRERVAELMGRNIAKMDEVAAVTIASLVAEAEAARAMAMEEKQPAAAIAALTAKAKLAGKWVERSERTTKTDDLNTLSDSELAAIVRQGQPEPVQPNLEANKKLN